MTTLEKREQEIWNLLMEEIKNPYGVAGLMGNLFAESGLDPYCVAATSKDIFGHDYANYVDDGTILRYQFAHDKIAFGLAQWRYWSRKEGLYNYCAGHSISSLRCQIGYLLKEIKTYKTVWKVLTMTKSVSEASDIVMLKYEKPATTTEAAMARRSLYASRYFEKYSAIKEPVSKLYTVTILHLTEDKAKELTTQYSQAKMIKE